MLILRAVFWWLLVVGFALTVVLVLTSGPAEYDYAISKHKLEVIGKAIQLYRSELPTVPLSKVKTIYDVGLPPLAAILAKPGHRWSLIEGISGLQLSKREKFLHGNVLSFNQLYWTPAVEKKFGLPNIVERLHTRGERLPILADMNAGQFESYGLRPKVPIVVLRLNGIVEVVEVDGRNMSDIWRK